MAKTAVYDYSTTASSNSDFDGTDSSGATGKVKDGDNYARSIASHVKGFALDLGAANTVAGTGDAITVTLASNPTALVDGMRFSINAPGTNTGAATIAVTNSGATLLGTKKVRKWSGGAETALSAGDITSGHIISLVYDSARDSASGAFMIDGANGLYLPLTGGTVTGNLRTSALLGAGAAAVASRGALQVASSNTPANPATSGSTDASQVATIGNPTVSMRVGVKLNGDIWVQPSLINDYSSNFNIDLLPNGGALQVGGKAVGITLGTPVASTSGTSIDFTSIPSGVKRVTFNFSGVSASGTSNWLLQIGDSGGIENTGYVSGTDRSGGGVSSSTAGFLMTVAMDAGRTYRGSYTLNLMDASTNTWCGTGLAFESSVPLMYFAAGSKALSATLDRVRFTTVGGADTFDAGSVNISYELP